MAEDSSSTEEESVRDARTPQKDQVEPQKENEEPQKYNVNENAGRSENGEMESVEDEQEEERVCGEERTREISKESLGSGQNLSLKPHFCNVSFINSSGKKL